MDVEKHYLRKENLLFPYLEKYGITGPPRVMWGKHNEIRELLKGSIDVLNNPEGLTPEEIGSAYEWNTGQAIVRRFADLDPQAFTAVLVRGHGPFCWGESARQAAHTAFVLEALARLAYQTVALDPSVSAIPDALRDKHFRRKHGKGAYYGQG